MTQIIVRTQFPMSSVSAYTLSQERSGRLPVEDKYGPCVNHMTRNKIGEMRLSRKPFLRVGLGLRNDMC